MNAVVRKLSAAMIAVVVLYLSVLSHLVAGGMLPSLTPMLVLIALSGAIVMAAAGRTMTFASTFAFVAIGELVFHIVLAVTHHGSGLLPGPKMLIAHLIAALIATLLIRSVDGVAAAWCRFVAVMLGEHELVPARTPQFRHTHSDVAHELVNESWVHHLHARRGPPTHH